jgi:hypothetical protein
MVVGLPGTGLGGIFYLMLMVAMPIRELVRAVRTRSLASPHWRLIGVQMGLVAGMVAGMSVACNLLNRAVLGIERLIAASTHHGAGAVAVPSPTSAAGTSVVGIGLICLAVIFLVVQALRCFYNPPGSQVKFRPTLSRMAAR